MGKIRVFEAAKQHECDVHELLDELQKLDVKVRSHLSPVSEEDIAKAVAKMGKAAKKAKAVDAAPSDDAAKLKPVLRRRKKASVEGAFEEAEAAVEEEVVAVKAIDETPAAEAEAGGAAEIETEAKPAAEVEEPAAVEAEAEQPVAGAEQEAQPEEKAEVKEEEKAEVPAEKAEKAEEEDSQKDEFKLKVVRFIHTPIDDKTSAPAFTYHMSKEERQAKKASKKGKRKKSKREAVREEQSRAPQKTQITVPKASKRRIRVSEVITVSDLSQRMGVKGTELIKKLLALGVFVTINQTIDTDTASLVAEEFGYEVENITVGEDEMLTEVEDRPEDLESRPPVVTVMGHVDHGKTSLLDAIRKTRVADGEAGGITQHIGAYEVETAKGRVVFLDTPGHEAFTALRARGAQVTDITVLVVAADDGIMPQTVEAIDHSKAAGVPVIVAINKIDKTGGDIDKVLRELTEHGLIPEQWGGDLICVPVSAKKGDGIDQLLEMIALQSEIMELKANPNKPARGTVIEARIDKGRGPVATVLIQEGTLNAGDVGLASQFHGRIRVLTNDKGKRVSKVGPCTPVEITGLGGVPMAGDQFFVVETERMAREISSRRADKVREEEMVKARKTSLADFQIRMAEGIAEEETQELPLIIKGDVRGSVEALSQAVEKLSTDEVKVNVIHGAVGSITENDVSLAIASKAIIIGFNIRPEAKAAAMAGQTGVDLRLYSVIYDATDDVRKALTGLLEPIIEEKVLGRAEVRQTFKVPKIGTIAGCYVSQGLAQRNAKARLLRDGVVVYQGELASLKRFKDDAKEVREGLECGLSIKNFNDIKVGDEVEFYIMEEQKREL